MTPSQNERPIDAPWCTNIRADRMANAVSTLDTSCDQYVGCTVYVAPFYGYGWTSEIKSPPKPWDWVPTPFHVRILRIYEHRGNRRGFVGKVDEAGHEFHNLWIVCMTRHCGRFDFDKRP